MTITTDLQKMEQIKKDIHTAIADKGVNIPNDTPYEDYPEKISDISGGGGSGYSYNKFSGTVHNNEVCASYLDTTIQNNVLPNYDLFNGEDQYVLMPLTNQYLDESGKYKKVKAVVHNANPYLYNNGATIVDGIASGFDNSLRLAITRPIQTNCVYTFKVKQTSSATYAAIFAYAGWIGTADCYLGMWTSNLYKSDKQIELNKWYFIRVVDNGTFNMYCLEAGDYTYDTLPELSQWEQVLTGCNRMGSYDYGCFGHNFAASGEYWRGEIDLTQSKILVNNEVYWEYPQDSVEYTDMYGCLNYTDDGSAKSVKAYCVKGSTEDKIVLGNQPSIVGATVVELGNVNVPAHDLYDYSEQTTKIDHIPEQLIVMGSPTINGPVAGGFSTSNFLRYDISFNETVDTFDIQMKYKVGSNPTVSGRLFNGLSDMDSVRLIGLTSNPSSYDQIFSLYGGNNFFFNGLSAEAGTDLTIRFFTENGMIKLYYKLNNGNWQQYEENGVPKEIAWTSHIVSFNGMSFGYRYVDGNPATVLDGDIDFSECYICFNDTYILQNITENVEWTKRLL